MTGITKEIANKKGQTMADNMRKEFEAWFDKIYHTDAHPDYGKRMAWEAWKAARQPKPVTDKRIIEAVAETLCDLDEYYDWNKIGWEKKDHYRERAGLIITAYEKAKQENV